MAIDGVITKSKRSPFGVRIHIGPRNPRPYLAQTGDVVSPGSDPAGQEWLDIQDATVHPDVGDEVWGGSDRVFIVSGGVPFPYRRVGYTRLVQDWPATAHEIQPTAENAPTPGSEMGPTTVKIETET